MNTPEEIENKRVETLKSINLDRERLNILLVEKHSLEKRLQELVETIRQAKYLLAVKKTEIDILTSQFWSSKS